MRPELLLVVVLAAGAGLVAGCIDGGEQLDPQSTAEMDPQPDASPEDDEAEAGEEDEGTDEDASSSDEGSETQEEDAGTGNDTEDQSDVGIPVQPQEPVGDPMAVVAHIDTGINPYHEAFRDDSDLAYTHPSEYIDGYPEDAQALELTLDAESWEQAVEADQDVWNNVTEGELYWVPGTRIVGAMSAGAGGTFCPPVEAAPGSYVGDPTSEGDSHRCTETPILDDHGHGTMTASRMAGEGTSLCPDCRIVSIEGSGSEQVRWAAETGWIDVQTNSWASLVPEPANGATDEGFAEDIEAAADSHLVYFASGNGFAGLLGFTPWPTHLQPTLREDVVWVGAHDNGKVAHWQGTPPHIVADGYRGLAAPPDTLEGVEPSPFACCTSASAPYAAGLGARLVEHARTVFDDTSEGAQQGVLAEGPKAAVASGPLDDGQLTVDELRELVKHAAEPRPSEGRHDGDAHWASGPAPEQAVEQSDPWGPGGNPYCPGCMTLPAEWSEIPSDVPAYTIVGYGGATPAALQDALGVVEGFAAEADRSDVDEYFAMQQPVRDLVQDPDVSP